MGDAMLKYSIDPNLKARLIMANKFDFVFHRIPDSDLRTHCLEYEKMCREDLANSLQSQGATLAEIVEISVQLSAPTVWKDILPFTLALWREYKAAAVAVGGGASVTAYLANQVISTLGK
jgi:hypothetical protein